jgi:outer membrane protein
MMINAAKYIIIALGLCLSLSASAQKFGYINSQELIQQIPQVKEVNAELETLRTQYEKQGQDKIAALTTKYQALERKQAQGEISPKQLEVEAQVLKQEELEIAKFQQDVQQQLIQKSEQLLNPIRDNIQNAINEVAQDNGYTYIFDLSMGIILYADDSTNVSDLVKAKLGL